LTKHAILTPMLMVISMITGDFFAMSSTTAAKFLVYR
jgi:H+-transporting ATPase